MTNKITLQPSMHTFFVEKHDNILDAALKAGMSVNYGCNNGSCGKCKAKLISGDIEKIAHQDFVFSEAEKIAGQFLMCRHELQSDSIIETIEVSDTDQIEQQQLQVKIKKIETPINGIKILHVRSPRSQRLRYIAGQHVKLFLDEDFRTISVASCPCDALNQQFHITYDATDDFYTKLIDDPNIQSLNIEGPQGRLILQESCKRPLLFIAYATGFAPVKGLIEHAISLELQQEMILLWVTETHEQHYMHNYCRSIADAVDNFSYIYPSWQEKNIPSFPEQDQNKEQIFKTAIENIVKKTVQNIDLNQFRIYISGNSVFTNTAQQTLITAGASSDYISTESLIKNLIT